MNPSAIPFVALVVCTMTGFALFLSYFAWWSNQAPAKAALAAPSAKPAEAVPANDAAHAKAA